MTSESINDVAVNIDIDMLTGVEMWMETDD